MQKLFGRVLFWSVVSSMTTLLILLTVTSVVIGAAGKILLAVAEAVIDIATPITDVISKKLGEVRKASNKLTVLEVTEESYDEYDAAWIDEALGALRRGETVRLDGVEEILARHAEIIRESVEKSRLAKEAWDKMSPVERYMATHPADKGGPKTVDEALAAMQAEAGRPFDFNDPAVRPVGNVTGMAVDGGILQQSGGPTLPQPTQAVMQNIGDALVGKGPYARAVEAGGTVNGIRGQEPERATHGYTPDEPAKVETRVPTSDMSQQQILDEAIAFGTVRSSELVNGRFVVDAGLSAPMDAEEFVNRARSLHGIKTEATHGVIGMVVGEGPVRTVSAHNLDAAREMLNTSGVGGFPNPANLSQS